MNTYDGPVSDHFDGTHFFDPDGVPPKSLGEVLRWQFGRGRQRAELAGVVAEPLCRHAAGAGQGQPGAPLVRRSCQLADPGRGA